MADASCPRYLEPGVGYVKRIRPLTTEKPSGAPFTFKGAGSLKGRPVGALLGAVAAGAFHLLKPELMGDGWAEGAFLIFCMTAGDLLQRLIHWGAGWHIDPKLRHLASTREADLQFSKLVYYRRRRILSPAEANEIAARIARADIAGNTNARATGAPVKRPAPKRAATGPVSLRARPTPRSFLPEPRGRRPPIS